MASTLPNQVYGEIEDMVTKAGSAEEAGITVRIEQFKADLAADSHLSTQERSSRIAKLREVLETAAKRHPSVPLSVACGTAIRILDGEE